MTDNFSFVRKPLTGNGSITAQVTSLTGLQQSAAYSGPNTAQSQDSLHAVQPWSKAGIIIKQSTKQGSAYAAMMVTGGHGVRMQYDYTQDIAGIPGSVSTAHPRWLRLTRSGDAVTGYDSADGVHWTRVGSADLTGLPATVQVGCSPPRRRTCTRVPSFGDGRLRTACPPRPPPSFDHVRRLRPGTAARGPETRSEASRTSGRAARALGGLHRPAARYRHRIRRHRTGRGRPGIGRGHPAPSSSTWCGAFAGLIAVAVVAAMFITAEYRRGLIRRHAWRRPRAGARCWPPRPW